jgi:ribosomal protein S6E (S10)
MKEVILFCRGKEDKEGSPMVAKVPLSEDTQMLLQENAFLSCIFL